MIWLGLMFLFLVLEIGHPGLLYFISFACGALGAFVASTQEYSFFLQAITFFAMTLCALMVVHKFVKRSMHDLKSHRSNVDQLLGKTVRITEVQSAKIGYGKLGGEIWLVKLQGAEELRVGMKATVVGIQGCHLQVQVT